MVYFGKFLSQPVGKCQNMERSDQVSPIGKQKKIAQLIAGHPVVYKQITNASSILDLFATSPDANIGGRSYEAVNQTIYNILTANDEL
jgi:hypothetical protein